jgi:hypothetical protein
MYDRITNIIVTIFMALDLVSSHVLYVSIIWSMEVIAKSGTFYSTNCVYYTIAKTEKVFSLLWEGDRYILAGVAIRLVPETVGSNPGWFIFQPRVSAILTYNECWNS